MRTFPIGGAKVVRSSPDDQVTLIGAGVTLHNCLAAADQLGSDGIAARVVDLYSVKPIDTETLVAAAAATGDRLVVVEDHYPAGGIGGAVLEALNDAGHPAQHRPPGGARPAWLRDPRGAHGCGGDLHRSCRAGRPRSPAGLRRPRFLVSTDRAALPRSLCGLGRRRGPYCELRAARIVALTSYTASPPQIVSFEDGKRIAR